MDEQCLNLKDVTKNAWEDFKLMLEKRKNNFFYNKSLLKQITAWKKGCFTLKFY